ncbi:Crp/Fnr family transcriptional regulator, partial [Candidatus Magnetoovum chiemensis]
MVNLEYDFMEISVESLKEIELFSELDDDELEKLIQTSRKIRYPKNKVIFKEGEKGETVYIIISGQVKVYRKIDGNNELVLHLLGEGNFFGEMSLFDRRTRSASVAAIDECEFLEIKRNDYLSIIRNSPHTAISILKELSHRIRKDDDYLKSVNVFSEDDDTKLKVGGIFETMLEIINEAMIARNDYA